MNEEMLKSLVELIDESLAEIEELKKSDRFSASEIKLDGPGTGIAGKDSNGSMGKADDEEDEEADDEEGDDEEADKEVEKGEGKNSAAVAKAEGTVEKGEGATNKSKVPGTGLHVQYKGNRGKNGGQTWTVHHGDQEVGMIHDVGTPNQGGGMKEEYMKNFDAVSDHLDELHGMKKNEGKNAEADPNAGRHVAKADKEDEDKKDKDVEEKMKKSLNESNALIKSYVDQRLSPIESKLEVIMDLVKEVANSPVPSKGASYKGVAPLKKSADEGSEVLTKSVVVEKLFELKKSGTRVDSLDITSAELGGQAELTKIANKYNIK